MDETKPFKTCPHCGKPVHEHASFCPHCARSLQPRTEAKPPRRWRKLLLPALAALAVLTAGLLYWQASRPRVYDNGGAEVLYTDQDGTYQVLVGWMDDRFIPLSYIWQPVDEGDTLNTFPQCLYINYPESGTNAKDDFMAKVERVTAAFINTADEDWPWTCDEPVLQEGYVPEAARVCSIHFYAASGAGRLQWTIEMKNGDVIHLYQEAEADPLKVYQFTPEDTPLNTVEEVQALLDRLDDITAEDRFATVNVYLPPVTYDGGVTVANRINLYGTEDEAGNRTTFTGPVHMASEYLVSYVYDMDFSGPGNGVGLSVSGRLFLLNCRFDHWRTGVLVQNSWVSAFYCTFEDNEVGFHFNADDGSAIDSRYKENVFHRNGTAVLLERVGLVELLAFPGSVFSENEVDIDNRCEQALDISEAIFD